MEIQSSNSMNVSDEENTPPYNASYAGEFAPSNSSPECGVWNEQYSIISSQVQVSRDNPLLKVVLGICGNEL